LRCKGCSAHVPTLNPLTAQPRCRARPLVPARPPLVGIVEPAPRNRRASFFRPPVGLRLPAACEHEDDGR
jgi:hypothetical protein